MNRVWLAWLTLIAAPSWCQGGEFYAGAEAAIARFQKVGDSNRAITAKLASENISADQQDRIDDIFVAPVFGFRAANAWGVEVGRRHLRWSSTVVAHSGATLLIGSGTGVITPVSSVDFRSRAETTLDAYTLGLTFTPDLTTRGRLFSKLSVVTGEICSSVFEESTAIGRTPVYLDSRARSCRQLRAPSISLGYTYRTGPWSATGYGEWTRNVGSNDVVFVDGGGVGNQTMTTIGLRITHAW